MAQNTTRKTKFVGEVPFINALTGEIEYMQVSEIKEQDFNFYKLWMRDFISTLELVGNQKTKTCYWIIDNINRLNELTFTYRQIADNAGVSLETVRVTMKVLLETGFLRKKNSGCYIVNPNILYKGKRAGRLNVLHTYLDAEKPPEVSRQEKIQGLRDAITKLQKQLDKEIDLQLVDGGNEEESGVASNG